jgi:hypothetical protein
MVGWWLVLYYPIMGLLIYLGKTLADKYPNGSVARDSGEMALGCGILLLPGAPLILFIGSLIVRNPHEPMIQVFVGFCLFWLCTALVFGALVKFPSVQRAVGTSYNHIRALMFLKRS